tara:strand:+ start:57 stop:1265 length:1209 start_codon:yes stop_codon:yes gene_type:complete
MSQTKAELVNGLSVNAAADDAITVDSSGRVLIGTTTEGVGGADEFTIGGSGGIGMTIRSGDTSNGSIFFSDGTSGADEYRGFLQYQHNTNDLTFGVNGSERMRIDSSGNVGIGVTSVSSKLHLDSGGASTGIQIDSDTESSIDFNDHGGSAIRYRIGTNLSDNNSQFEIRDVTNSASRLRLDSSGRVLINRTSAFSTGTSGTESAKLQVGINASAGTAVGFADTGGFDTNIMVLNHARAGANSNSFAGVMIQFRNKDNTTVGGISCDIGATNYATSSDYRLKENVVDISDGITRLKTLKPCRFNWKLDKNKTLDGFLAHEVTAVPEAISGIKDGMKPETYYEEGDTLPSGKVVGDVKTYSSTEPDYQTIDQSKLVPLLTAALQEEIAKREALESRVATLEAA